ncbi:MAG: hypothetical protein K940chlam7_00830 [Chlamydiae bacterium]|nr:hypothetical protein [Chlamydiota bacterium]
MNSFPSLSPRIAEYHDHRQTITFTTKPPNAAMAEVAEHGTNVLASYTIHPNILEMEEVPIGMRTTCKKTIRWLLQHQYVPIIEKDNLLFKPPQYELSTSKWTSAGKLTVPGSASVPNITAFPSIKAAPAPIVPLNIHTFAIGLNNEIQIWDVEKKECIETIKVAGGYVPRLFHVRGKTWLSYGFHVDLHESCSRYLWDPDTKTLFLSPKTDHKFVDIWDRLQDGRLLVGNDSFIGLWNLDYKDGREGGLCLIDKSACIGAAIVLDDNHFAVGSECNVKIYNTGTLACIQLLNGHDAPICRLEVLANGTLVSSDRKGVVKVWDTDKNQCMHTDHAVPFEIDPAGLTKSNAFYVLQEGAIAIPHHSQLQIYHPEKGDRLQSFDVPLETHFIDVRQGNIGQDITLHSDHFIRVWDPQGKCIQKFQCNEIFKVRKDRFPIGPSFDEHISILDSELRVIRFEGHDAPLVQTIDLKHRGLLGVFNDHIMLWDVKTGKGIKNIPYTEGVISRVITLQNNTVVGVSGTRVLLWDLATESRLGSFEVGEGPITHLMSYQGDKVLIATEKYVKILDERIEKCLHIFQPTEGRSVFQVHIVNDKKIVLETINVQGIHSVDIWQPGYEKDNICRPQQTLLHASKDGILIFLDHHNLASPPKQTAYEVFDAKNNEVLKRGMRGYYWQRKDGMSSHNSPNVTTEFCILEDSTPVIVEIHSSKGYIGTSFTRYCPTQTIGVHGGEYHGWNMRSIGRSGNMTLLHMNQNETRNFRESLFWNENQQSQLNGWIMQLLADGRRIVLSGNNVLEVWDNKGKHLHDLECEPREQWKIIESVEGKIVGESDDHIIRVWDSETGKCSQTISGTIAHILDSGEIIIQTHRDMIKMWDLYTGKCVTELEGKTENVRAVLEDGSIFLQSSSQKDELEIFTLCSQDNTGDLGAAFVKPIDHATGHILATIKRDEPESDLSMICPLTQELVVDPVVDNHGHTFERKAIEEHIERCKNGPVSSPHPLKPSSADSNEEPATKDPWCPVSKEPITNLSPNLVVKGLADDMRAHPPIPIPSVLQGREIEENRKKVTLYHTLAQEFENDNELDKALYQYQEALNYTSRSKDYAPIAAILLKQKMRLKAALAHLYLAKLQIREKRLTSSMTSIETALQLYPFSELQEALVAGNLSLSLDQEGAAKYYLRLAEDYLKQDRIRDAVRCYERAYACQPDLLADCDPLLKLYETPKQKAHLCIRGILHFGPKDLAMATRLFERAKGLKSPEVYLAYIHQLQSVEDEKKKYETYRLLANLYKELDDFPNYTATLQKMIHWKTEEGFAELSAALVSNNEHDRAEKVYSKWADSLLCLGQNDHLDEVVRDGLEKIGDRIPLLEHAYVLNEKMDRSELKPEILFRLGKAHEKKRSVKEAEEYYRETHTLAPTYEVVNQLAHLLFNQDRKEEAVRLYFGASERAYFRQNFAVISDCFHQAKSMDPDMTSLNPLERTAFATQYYVSGVLLKS